MNKYLYPKKIIKIFLLILAIYIGLIFTLDVVKAQDLPPKENDPEYEKFMDDFYLKDIGYNEDYNYYSYVSRKYIIETISNNKKITFKRKIGIITNLEVDNYFLKTKKEKRMYLNRHIRREPFLSEVIRAERKHNWVSGDESQLNVNTSIEMQKAVLGSGGLQKNETSSNNASQDTAAVTREEILKGRYEKWKLIRDYAIKRAESKKCVADKPGTEPIQTKSCWSNPDLDWYYQEIRPELRGNRNQNSFTGPELKWLARIDEILLDDKPIKQIGLTGNSPIDDVLLLAGWSKFSKLFAPAYRYSYLKEVPMPTTQLAEVCTKRNGCKVFGFLRRIFVDQSGPHLKKIRGLVSRATGEVQDFTINLTEIFRLSDLTRSAREGIIDLLNPFLTRLSRDRILGRYFNGEAVRFMFNKISFLSARDWVLLERRPNVVALTVPTSERGLYGIFVNEVLALVRNTTSDLNEFIQYVFHELIHARAMRGRARDVKWFSKSHGYAPVEEGTVEFLTREFLTRNGVKSIGSSYPQEENVIFHIYLRLTEKYGGEAAERILAEAQMNGFETLDSYLGEGAMDVINCLMKENKYGRVAEDGSIGAVGFIDDLNLP